MKYTQVSAGDYHTVPLRSDGCAVECSLPLLDEGVTYTQVSASYDHVMLLQVMALLLLADGIILDNVKFLL